MSQTNRKTQNTNLSEGMITYLKDKITKKEESLLKMLYNYPNIQHKNLAGALEITSNGLSNLISNINNIYENFIIAEPKGRKKFYSLSQAAEIYTIRELLPKEAAQKDARLSFLHTDPITCDALDFLKKFQEFEGDGWDVVLDDLLFVETRDMSATNIRFSQETSQNYNNFKNALITLVIQQKEQSVQKVYAVLEQKILTTRLKSMVSSALSNYNKMKPLFLLEENDLKAAHSIIDKIFSEHSSDPAPIVTNAIHYINLQQTEYEDIDRVIDRMIKDFKNNNYDKIAFIEQWEKNLYTRNQYSISYIAEKCNELYHRHEKPPTE